MSRLMQILLSLMKGIQVPVILLFQIVVIQCDIFIGGGVKITESMQ